VSTPLDASRTYQWQAELIELVEAVLVTDPNNESTWIEWKSQLDLNARTGQEHVARHVLGFANRTVQRAAQHTGGYAYLIAGAEPGNLEGITPVDPATLHPIIVRWVGPDPRFHLEYIPVRAKTVLVVVIEPPMAGDQIHPVRSQLGKHEAGCVLVRRPGATHPANAHEIDELNARVRAGGSRISLSLEASPIEALPRRADFDELSEQERRVTLARPRIGEAKNTEEPYARALRALMASQTEFWQEPDQRTAEKYEQEVAKYAADHRQALEHTFAWMLWRHDPCWLHIEAQNTTDLNFTDVRLELHIAGAVRRWPKDWLDAADRDGEPAFPNRPAQLGTPKPRFNLGPGLLSPSVPLPRLIPASQIGGPRYNVTDTGSVTVVLERFDLRAQQRQQLLPVPVLVDAPAGTLLTCDWTATALNVSGQATGRFTLAVEESTFDADSALNADSHPSP
jgi:hypothetical protein